MRRGAVVAVVAGLATLVPAGVWLSGIAAAADEAQIIGVLSLPGYPNDVFVRDGLAYVGIGGADGALAVADVSDPANLRLLGLLEFGSAVNSVTADGGFVFMADDFGFRVVDVSDPAAPSLVATVGTNGMAKRVWLNGPFAYVACGVQGLSVVDVSNPLDPILVGEVSVPGQAVGVCTAGGNLFVAAMEEGLQTLDASEPSAPVALGAMPTVDHALGVFPGPGLVYLSWCGGLIVADIADPSNPREVGSVTMPDIAYVSVVKDGLAYVPCRAGGLQVVDVSVPDSPTVVASVEIEGEVLAVAVADAVRETAEQAPEAGEGSQAASSRAYIVGYPLGLAVIQLDP
ncbi:MAG: hypothetical protein NUW23_04665 [Firmicutes bacterium]|nr:hypothetical protein [Bacillota bacterium]